MRLNHSLKHLLLTPLVIVSMASCHSHSGHDHDHDHDHAHGQEHAQEAGHDEHADEHGHNHGADEILLEPADAERLGVEVDTVGPGVFTQTLKVSGEILPSSTDRAVVAAPTSGMVRIAGGINPGVQVRSGQTIASISARNVSGGDVNAAARAALDNAKRELDRVTPLLADGLVTRKEYNDALAAYESAKVAYSPSAASGVATAPRAGVVTSVSVGDGEYVETGQPIATVAANSTLTLRALVPVAQAAFLDNVNGAVMSFHSGRTIDIAEHNGRLLSSAPASAGETPGYIPVYFSFGSTAPVVPGSATEVYLKGAARNGVVSLPVEAIVEQMGEKFVFVRKGDHAYMKRPVVTGNSDGSRVEILSGLHRGETAVVKGATFVRLAEQATVAPEGHSHNH